MGYICVPQIMGLVRGTPKPGQKHRANVRAICAEAGKERISNSVTFDPTRSDRNEYEGFESGFACADDMTKRANEYRQQVSGKTKSGEPIIRERSLREDAVIGWAMIFNPPDEMTKNWTKDDYEKFDQDSWEVLCKIEPRIFRDSNVLMKSWHWDEGVPREIKYDLPGGHTHRIGDCLDENGSYCGNIIYRKLFEKVNKNYAPMMRERGWDIDEPDMTDWEKFYARDDDGNFINEEYRNERKKVLKSRGKTNTKYVFDKVSKTQSEASEILDQAVQVNAAATQRMELASDLMLEADAMQQYAKKAVSDAEEEAENQRADRNTYWLETKKYKNEVSDLMGKRDALSKEIEDRKKALDDFEAEAEEHREAISPTAAGTTKFVLNYLLNSKYKGDKAAQEALVKFIEDVSQHSKFFNKKHEEWREQMRERRRADKMTMAEEQEADRQNEGMEI